MAFQIFQFFIEVLILSSISLGGLIVSTKLGAKVSKAAPEELKREDDVLL